MKFTTALIWIGTITPAILSIYFIQNFAVPTVFQDEWEIVPQLRIIFSGEDIFSLNLHYPHNEHIPIFPKLILIALASISSYNIFLEIIVGWIFLSLTVLVLWFLLVKTNPEIRWLIVPISWLSYSFVQYENFLWGWASIHWHSTIFLVVTAIYFLNNAKESIKSLWLFVILSSIATFTHLIGAVTWLIGLTYFGSIKKQYFAIIVISFILISSSYFLLTDSQRNYGIISTNIDEPFEITKYVFIFLGNAFKITLDLEQQSLVSLTIGVIFFSIFVTITILYYFTKVGQKLKSNIRPWFNLCLFSFFVAIITGIGRIDFGIHQALSTRYVLVSNLFLDGIFVITIVMISYQIKNEESITRKKILKTILVILVILLALYIVENYLAGWYGATLWKELQSTGAECLINYKEASDDCLGLLYPNPETVRNRAKILEEYCLGPFSTICNE